ncbi:MULTISPECIES: iron ABC transporter permease [Microbacterium]|uniref:FecCD family ABC transporter permease n=1 Tax=Microbacterium TaxID=33882 RepID=UPI002787ED3B|nr:MULTISPECIES: iron ABC transporter permease [Microbacterium]MDQ1085444.1 iron complex transport system permease protein [Microbacterium sp. SORGH_AS_0344]MDQ1169250.1 iron complex transport system permease protein [Microbacterium proteolyticum]
MARAALLIGAALAVTVVCLTLGLMVGSRGIAPVAVWQALLGAADPEARAIVRDQRLPRTLIGIVGGAALAVAGVVVQGHTRNPLADPGLLGITAGSSLAVVVGISALGLTTPAGYLGAAFGGAALGTIVVVVIGLAASRRRDASPASLVLAGTAVSALLGAITGIILLLDSAALDLFRFWTVGSLSAGRDLDVFMAALVPLAVGGVLAGAHARALDVLVLGDDVAAALGRRLLPTRLLGLVVVTLLVGGATVAIGALGFVGLVAPHLARRVFGEKHEVLLPASAMLGSLLVVIADVVGRVIISPAELPVGVVLAVIGAPALLAIIVRTRKTCA